MKRLSPTPATDVELRRWPSASPGVHEPSEPRSCWLPAAAAFLRAARDGKERPHDRQQRAEGQANSRLG